MLSFKIEGTKHVIAKLQQESLKGRKKAELQVGYETPYAMIVHERLDVFHPIGQAKYLETPVRRYEGLIQQIITTELKRKKNMVFALTKAGFRLLDESRSFVPVDTGKLINSGFVRVIDK